MCHECYLDILNGDKKIRSHFNGKIAGESVFILPEGLLKDFNYDFLYKLKSETDLAFKDWDANNWLQNIEALSDMDEIKFYSINFIIYRTDGTSFDVLETIEDVPAVRFRRIMELIGENVMMLKPHIRRMSLASIYGLVPVHQNKDKKKFTGRVLSLYRSIRGYSAYGLSCAF